MKNDRRLSLALSHARLTAAKDLLVWSQSADTADVVSRRDVDEVVVKIKWWADMVWKALREVK